MTEELTKQQTTALDWHLKENIKPENIETVRKAILSDPIHLKNIVNTHEDHLQSKAQSDELKQKLAAQFKIGSQVSGQSI